MKKILGMMAALLSLTFVACSETKEENEFEGNWDERNVAYIDSVATVARANTGTEVGQWKVLKSYKLKEDNEGTLTAVDNQDYVYAKIVAKGSGTDSPIFTDSVWVNYRGYLIPTVSYPKGYVFDQNFYGEMSVENGKTMAVESGFKCSGVVVGWTTALQYMHAGDIWRLYLPQKLGYGATVKTGIPAYSTLVFDVYLRGFGEKRPPVWQ